MGQCYVVMLQGEAAVQHYGVMCGVMYGTGQHSGVTLWGSTVMQSCMVTVG